MKRQSNTVEIMVNRKRKRYIFTLSDKTNNIVNDLSQSKGINRSKLIEEALSYYNDNHQNVHTSIETPTEVYEQIITSDEDIESVHTIEDEDKFKWLDDITVHTQPTNVTEYTIQETESNMKFNNFAHLMNESEKYEIKGPKLVLKEEYKEQEDAKVNAPITTMSSLIQEAQDNGLSLKH